MMYRIPIRVTAPISGSDSGTTVTQTGHKSNAKTRRPIPTIRFIICMLTQGKIEDDSSGTAT